MSSYRHDDNMRAVFSDEELEVMVNHTRRAWEAGHCPCCGGELIPWPGPDGIEHQPEAIGENVMMCGRCMGNEHYIEMADFILKSLLPKNGKT